MTVAVMVDLGKARKQVVGRTPRQKARHMALAGIIHIQLLVSPPLLYSISIVSARNDWAACITTSFNGTDNNTTWCHNFTTGATNVTIKAVAAVVADASSNGVLSTTDGALCWTEMSCGKEGTPRRCRWSCVCPAATVAIAPLHYRQQLQQQWTVVATLAEL